MLFSLWFCYGFWCTDVSAAFQQATAIVYRKSEMVMFSLLQILQFPNTCSHVPVEPPDYYDQERSCTFVSLFLKKLRGGEGSSPIKKKIVFLMNWFTTICSTLLLCIEIHRMYRWLCNLKMTISFICCRWLLHCSCWSSSEPQIRHLWSNGRRPPRYIWLCPPGV